MKFRFTPILTVILVTLAVFAPVLSFEFTNYDDGGHIQENRHVQNFDLQKIWSEPYFGMYIPVTYTIWSATKLMSDHSAVFHGLNLLFHVANAGLVFWLLSQWGFRPWASVSGALFFSLHPVQVEAVAWISSFRDVLSAFWGLVFLNFVFRSKENWKTFSLATVFLVLAILSKPSGVVFAVVPPLYWLWQSRRPKLILLAGSGLWLTVALGLAAFAKSIQPAETLIQHPSILERIAIMAKSLAFYSWKILDASGLSPDYGLAAGQLVAEWNRSGLPFLQILSVMLVLGAILYFFWKRNAIAFGLLLAIVLVSPYLGLIPFNFQNTSIVADRYLYLCLIGIAFALAVLEPKQQNKVSYAANLAIWAFVIFFTFKQIGVWKNNRTLYTEMSMTNPQSYIAMNGLGVLEMEAGNLNPAIEHLQKSVTLNPGYYFARYNLARALELSGEPIASLNQYVETINGQPQFVQAYLGLGALLFNQGRFDDSREAVRRGLLIQSDHPGLLSLKAELDKK